MKTKDVVRLLLAADPTGEAEVNVEGQDITYIGAEPGYYDGCYQVIDRPEQGFPTGATIRDDGTKITIGTISIKSILLDVPTAEIKYGSDRARASCETNVEEWRAAAIRRRTDSERDGFITWVQDRMQVDRLTATDAGAPFYNRHYTYDSPMPPDIRDMRHRVSGGMYATSSWWDRRQAQYDREVEIGVDGAGNLHLALKSLEVEQHVPGEA